MQAKNILLCVSGGIAAYKAIDLASLLTKAGYNVKTAMSHNAGKFVSPVNFSTITHNQVHEHMFDANDPIPHINLADWADLVVVAPATANILAKAACGIADDLLSTVLVAHTKPVLFVPAMNVNMFNSQSVQDNIQVLAKRGHHMLQPATGVLACGYVGKGKYPHNDEVMAAIATYLCHTEDLQGLKVMVTAGPTVEPIDPMRYISNRSSGKMGIALARALTLRGADVCLIHGEINVAIPHNLHEAVPCSTADSMYNEVMARAKDMDWIVKCAAVADYAPQTASLGKLPKRDELNLKLVKTRDILLELGERKTSRQKLVGFAAQTEDLIPKALEKLVKKNLDLVCANKLDNAGADGGAITVIGKIANAPVLPQAREYQFCELTGDKLSLAHGIIDIVLSL